jgi:2-methylisocitrate lyase-like PEP mutase family enzyme
MATQSFGAPERNQTNNAEAFRKLHVPGNPLVLYNIWDAGSAKVVAASGARAIATSSWAVAKAHGFDDGEHIPFELAMENLKRIVSAVELPVSVDLEGGYGDEPERVAKNVSLAITSGAIGCNLEDSVPATGMLRDSKVQEDRIRASRKAAQATGVPFFINARCDLFFLKDGATHDEKLLAKLLDRVHAYAAAGADGLFVPGLATIPLIGELAKRSPIPVNILAGTKTSIQALADNGVARVSYGATPYADLTEVLKKAAQSIGERH